jgi:DNA-binding Lrp family transcriptional regulator
VKEIYQLDAVEEKLLPILQTDASLSISDLAEATNSSAATCWRRLKDLEDNGVIGPPVRIVDPARIGRNIDVFCQVRMKSQDAVSRDTLIRALDLEPTIVEVYSTSGDWDYLLHLVVRDIADLETILMRRVLELECVATTSTLFALRRIKHTTKIPA